MDIRLFCFQCMASLETEDQLCPHCGYNNRIRVNPNGWLPYSTIKKRYLIGKALGHGGFGVTYIGMDLALNRRVAIKEYLPTDLVRRDQGQSVLEPFDEESRKRFEQGRERSQQEARTIASLTDVPDAVNVFDVFIANNTLYIVMEYIDGITLRERVKKEGGKIAPEPLLKMLMPIIKTLEQIHAQGIIHRDVSPDNIMLRNSNGRAVLLDFGAAHPYEAGVESEHSTSLRPGYAPVEQYSRNSKQDARTDEYALCATMYYAITGEKPSPSMERAFGDSELPPPSTLSVAMPPAFEAVLMKGLSVHAKERYENIAALEDAFVAALQTENPLFREDSGPTVNVTEPARIDPAPKKQKSKGWIGALIAVACLVVGGALFAIFGIHPNGNPLPMTGQVSGSVQGADVTESANTTQTGSPGDPQPSLSTATPGVAATPIPADQLVRYQGKTHQLGDATVYQSSDGWLYEFSDNRPDLGRACLLGLTESDRYRDISTLTLPDTVDGYPVREATIFFSENCFAPAQVKELVLPDSLEGFNFKSFQAFDYLESVQGGKNMTFCNFYSAFSPLSPYYQANIQKNVVMGNSILVHGVPVQDASGSSVTVDEGILSIAPYAFNYLDSNGDQQSPAYDQINLPSSLKTLRYGALEGFAGTQLNIPDGVAVNYHVFSYKQPPNLDNIHVGKGVTFDYNDSKQYSDSMGIGSFEIINFSGTLYLEDGETLPTLQGLFAKDSRFTLSCLSNAVPADTIPDGVTIVYRDKPSEPTATPAASGSETVYGTVGSEDTYMNGKTIYRSPDGWLYLKDDYNVYLWGIAGDHTLGDLDTLDIPSQIQGSNVTWIYDGFSSKIENNGAGKVRCLSIPDTVYGVWFNALEQLTSLTTIEGGNGLESFSFNSDVPKTCPYYQNNMYNNLIMGKGVLVHYAIGTDGVVNIPEGVTRILAFPLYTLDKHSNYVQTSITSLTLPDSLQTLGSLSLASVYGTIAISELSIPDGVTLDKWVFGNSSSADTKIDSLETIYLGKGIHYSDTVDSDLTVFPEFEGTLYLEDSATLDTLVGLFPVGSEYTLSCLSGAVPKDNIPDGVTVDYRDEASGAADKSAASGGETVYGTVVSDESYLSGRTIYRSAEGWLYLKDDYNIYLWGIDKKNTLPDVETITIPDQIQGMDVTWIYEGFSSRIEKNNGADVKSLVIPDTVIGVWFNALEQFTGLTTIEGGNGLESFSFNGDVPESCPFYRNNMFNNLILGKGLLVHCSIGEDGAVKIPKGVTRMLAFPLYTLSKDNYYVETSITSITLPDSLQALDALTLAPTYGSLHISEFRVPDGVTLDKWVFGDSSDSKNIIEELKTIRIGKHVQLGEFVASDLTVFPKFKGTLYLEDGATLDTLVGLFPAGSKYTLSCEKDAVPDSGIPKGVKVKVR